MPKFLRLSVIGRVSLGLASIAVVLVLTADMLVGSLPDKIAVEQRMRERVTESLALQVATLVQHGDERTISDTLTAIIGRRGEIRSAALRLNSGELIAVAGPHEQIWRTPADGKSTLTHVQVPIQAQGRAWGHMELTWTDIGPLTASYWLTNPKVFLPVLLGLPGFLLFYLYLRRVLQHLDPSAAIPERVRSAYDVLTEGVIVLDVAGRIVLANEAFAKLAGDKQQLAGRRLENLPLIASASRAQKGSFPWQTSLRDQTPVVGFRIDLTVGDEDLRAMVVSCTPIQDGRGAVRGILVVFLDRTEIERSNVDLGEALTRLKESTQQIEKQNVELRRLATTDPLSGALNRRAFFERANMLCENDRLAAQHASCLLVDIDHFKQVNDQHGHQVGDRAIASVARVLQSSVRDSDLVCRYGGEEFAVLLHSTSVDRCVEVAERIRIRIEAEAGAAAKTDGSLKITTSIGVCSLDARHTNVESLVGYADKALYRAKRSGRNRVCVFEESLDAERPRKVTATV